MILLPRDGWDISSVGSVTGGDMFRGAVLLRQELRFGRCAWWCWGDGGGMVMDAVF